MESRFHKYLCILNSSNSINQMDKVGKHCQLGNHNDNLYINCNLGRCINYMKDSIVFQRYKYFLVKLNLYLYYMKQMQFCLKLEYLIIQVQNSQFQLQKEEHRKIQMSQYKLLGIVQDEQVWQFSADGYAQVRVMQLVEGVVQVIKFAVVEVDGISNCSSGLNKFLIFVQVTILLLPL
ncbi:unnamed protein product [Paramecium sonneborni]|uniref:Uncharacterized protein n=1 Tax=Paramecium sonneborni TaxID=65129 RepID=A0A8S1RRJ9_9CILI|nr:unnamed protein product [Paramecium sonneborni]